MKTKKKSRRKRNKQSKKFEKNNQTNNSKKINNKRRIKTENIQLEKTKKKGMFNFQYFFYSINLKGTFAFLLGKEIFPEESIENTVPSDLFGIEEVC